MFTTSRSDATKTRVLPPMPPTISCIL
jgi:hypothetical protein